MRLLTLHRRINDESPMGKPVARPNGTQSLTTSLLGLNTRAFQRHEFAPRRELMETRRGMRRALIKRNAPSLPLSCVSLSVLSQRATVLSRRAAFTQIFLTFFFFFFFFLNSHDRWFRSAVFLSFPPPGPWTRFPAGIRRNLLVMLGRARAIGNLRRV